MKDCPCGTGFPYTDCCGPWIRGVGHADTAEDLMRSRFSAFSLGDWDYLEKSLHPDERTSCGDACQQQKGIRWTRLEILESKKGGTFDEEGEVSFAAYFTQDGENKNLQETAKFLRVNGQWYYSQRTSKVMSKTLTASEIPYQRNQAKIGRNDPCPCNSGKKFKKCCGK